jgi:uncharacterized protein (DUF885 family)
MGAGLSAALAPRLMAQPARPASALLEAITDDLLRLFPERASDLGIDTGARAALRGSLVDRSTAGQRAIADQLRRRLREIDRLDMASVAPAERVHLEVVRTSFDTALKGFAFPCGDVAVGEWRNSPYVVIQNVGAFIDMPRLLESTQKLDSPADAAAYLARVGGYAAALDGETERLQAATARGVIPPAFLLDKAIPQLTGARGGDPAKWPWIARLAAKYPAEGARAVEIARAAIVPAFDRQIAALKAQRRRAGQDAGVWRLPDGDAYYRWALGAATTSTRTPEEIHAQGLDELKRYQAQMDAILRRLGLTQGSVGARMAALGRDPKYLFPETDAGRAQVLAYARARIDAIRPLMPRAFANPVQGNVEVLRVPLAEEPGAAGAYGGAGSIDGTIPGKYWMNLSTTARWPQFAIASTTYHEAIPGHVWQGEYSHRLPLIRSLLSFSAYGEGWALYAEQLADELGVYADDTVARLGYLQAMAFRACRLVVDTGLHARRWTRAQAIAWFAEANGQEPGEVASEVDRYCSWPGQACAYKVGHSEINRMRDAARTRLGARYDVRAFNDLVVGTGAVPMTVLDDMVRRTLV